MGKNFDPRFRPDLTPKQMLSLGIFGSVYMRDCRIEFPEDWFTKAKFQKEGIYVQDPKLNFFKIRASQPLSVWHTKGWIHKKTIRAAGFSGIADTMRGVDRPTMNVR